MGKAEGYVENYLKTQAEKQGFLCQKFVSPSNSGVPDRVLIGYGKTIFIETKSKDGKLRVLQEKIIEIMRKHGAIIYVANTRPQVLEILNEIKNNNLKYRPMATMKKNEIKYILDNVIGLDYEEIKSIKYNKKENQIEITISEIWDVPDDSGTIAKVLDTEDIIFTDESCMLEYGQTNSNYDYVQYILAKKYHKLWKDNKYA